MRVDVRTTMRSFETIQVKINRDTSPQVQSYTLLAAMGTNAVGTVSINEIDAPF